jgi:hypothetical protein
MSFSPILRHRFLLNPQYSEFRWAEALQSCGLSCENPALRLAFREQPLISQCMKILSLKQPWAALIVHGFKDIENRSWSTRYRGPVLIHASQRQDRITVDEIERRFGVRLNGDLLLGGIVGITEIIDCVRPHPSQWYFPGCHAFILANSRPLPFVPWKGRPSR